MPKCKVKSQRQTEKGCKKDGNRSSCGRHGTSLGAKGCCFSFGECACRCVCMRVYVCVVLNSTQAHLPFLSFLSFEPLYRPIFHGQLKPRMKQSSPWAAATRRPTRRRATTYCRRTMPSPGLTVVWLITPPARVHSVRSKLLVCTKRCLEISIENNKKRQWGRETGNGS